MYLLKPYIILFKGLTLKGDCSGESLKFYYYQFFIMLSFRSMVAIYTITEKSYFPQNQCNTVLCTRFLRLA